MDDPRTRRRRALYLSIYQTMSAFHRASSAGCLCSPSDGVPPQSSAEGAVSAYLKECNRAARAVLRSLNVPDVVQGVFEAMEQCAPFSSSLFVVCDILPRWPLWDHATRGVRCLSGPVRTEVEHVYYMLLDAVVQLIECTNLSILLMHHLVHLVDDALQQVMYLEQFADTWTGTSLGNDAFTLGLQALRVTVHGIRVEAQRVCAHGGGSYISTLPPLFRSHHRIPFILVYVLLRPLLPAPSRQHLTDRLRSSALIHTYHLDEVERMLRNRGLLSEMGLPVSSAACVDAVLQAVNEDKAAYQSRLAAFKLQHSHARTQLQLATAQHKELIELSKQAPPTLYMGYIDREVHKEIVDAHSVAYNRDHANRSAMAPAIHPETTHAVLLPIVPWTVVKNKKSNDHSKKAKAELSISYDKMQSTALILENSDRMLKMIEHSDSRAERVKKSIESKLEYTARCIEMANARLTEAKTALAAATSGAYASSTLTTTLAEQTFTMLQSCMACSGFTQRPQYSPASAEWHLVHAFLKHEQQHRRMYPRSLLATLFTKCCSYEFGTEGGLTTATAVTLFVATLFALLGVKNLSYM